MVHQTLLCAVVLPTDRAHGHEFSRQFEESCQKLDDYVHFLEVEIKDRADLIEMLEQSEIYYDAQYGEAKIVANVSIVLMMDIMTNSLRWIRELGTDTHKALMYSDDCTRTGWILGVHKHKVSVRRTGGRAGVRAGGRAGGQADGRTDGRTDGWTDWFN